MSGFLAWRDDRNAAVIFASEARVTDVCLVLGVTTTEANRLIDRWSEAADAYRNGWQYRGAQS